MGDLTSLLFRILSFLINKRHLAPVIYMPEGMSFHLFPGTIPVIGRQSARSFFRPLMITQNDGLGRSHTTGMTFLSTQLRNHCIPRKSGLVPLGCLQTHFLALVPFCRLPLRFYGRCRLGTMITGVINHRGVPVQYISHVARQFALGEASLCGIANHRLRHIIGRHHHKTASIPFKQIESRFLVHALGLGLGPGAGKAQSALRRFCGGRFGCQKAFGHRCRLLLRYFIGPSGNRYSKQEYAKKEKSFHSSTSCVYR